MWSPRRVVMAASAVATTAHAQPAEPAAPVEAADEVPEPVAVPNTGALAIHVLSSQGAYVRMRYDVWSVATQQVVASGRGAREHRGQVITPFELPPGLYKITRQGEPFDTRVDFAIATVEAGKLTDYMVVVDPDTDAFRGSGPVIGDLPRGTEIAGMRLSLNAGGSILLNQRYNAVGATSGTNTVVNLFGNFGLVFDRGPHFVDISSDVRLDLLDQPTGSFQPTHDRFQASALYSYKLSNDYVGPYVRVSMQTRLFPGYVYFERDTPTVDALIHRLDGTTEMRTLGGAANPDDLRLRVATPFAPLRLQEELGANLKAVDLDLLLVKLVVGTRVGFGFRQGFMNDLLVVRGSEGAATVVLDEVDDYTTLGPVVGANAQLTFTRWLFARGRFTALAPLTNTAAAGTTFGARLLVEVAGTAGFKVPILTNLLHASADYTFRIERDGFVTRETQVEHALMARATVTLF